MQQHSPETDQGTPQPGVYIPGGEVLLPKVKHSIDPKFPHGQRIYGVYVLTFIVSVDGELEKIMVKQSLRPDYDESAAQAIRKFRFKPAMKNE